MTSLSLEISLEPSLRFVCCNRSVVFQLNLYFLHQTVIPAHVWSLIKFMPLKVSTSWGERTEGEVEGEVKVSQESSRIIPNLVVKRCIKSFMSTQKAKEVFFIIYHKLRKHYTNTLKSQSRIHGSIPSTYKYFFHCAFSLRLYSIEKRFFCCELN